MTQLLIKAFRAAVVINSGIGWTNACHIQSEATGSFERVIRLSMLACLSSLQANALAYTNIAREDCQYRATPIVQLNKGHKKLVGKYGAFEATPEWKALYKQRQAVERVFGRLKGHRKLNSIRVRGLGKVTVHCYLALIVLQAQAVATESRMLVRKVA